MPAFSYACLDARRVSVLTSGKLRSRSVHGSEVSTEAATRARLRPPASCFSLSSDTRIAAAAPSPVGQHIYNVLGYATIRAFITSASVTSLRYWENGFLVACLCDLTEILAKCSGVVPYLRMCSIPAWPKTAGIRPEPSLPSVP